jgi:hypothetical protein
VVFRRRRRPPRSAPQIADDNQRAYVLVEEARLRCERICAASPRTRQSSLLAALHRELGLAGYHCSEDLDATNRQLLLEQARQRATAKDAHATDEITLLVSITASARRALADHRDDDESAARMHVALMHLLCAAELLDGLVAQPPGIADSRERIR